jgi:hypothetical protein
MFCRIWDIRRFLLNPECPTLEGHSEGQVENYLRSGLVDRFVGAQANSLTIELLKPLDWYSEVVIGPYLFRVDLANVALKQTRLTPQSLDRMYLGSGACFPVQNVHSPMAHSRQLH